MNEAVQSKLYQLIDKSYSFGAPGACLTEQLHLPKFTKLQLDRGLIASGITGEKRTGNLLCAIASKVNENVTNPLEKMLVFHSVRIRNGSQLEIDMSDDLGEEGFLQSVQDTDHLVLYRGGAVIVDAKNWKRGNYTVSDGQVKRGGRAFKSGKVHLTAARKLWSDYLGINVYGIINIAKGEDEKVAVHKTGDWYKAGYRLTCLDTLEEVLLSTVENFTGENDLETVYRCIGSLVKPVTAGDVLRKKFNLSEKFL